MRMSQYTANQIVFVDESSVNETTGSRRWGWSDIGSRTLLISTLHGPQRWTILPALSVDGYVCSKTIQEGFDRTQFVDFVRHNLLPVMQPYPADRSVVVMDNCAIHHGEEVQLFCNEARVHLEFLPPYSPWLNPIEKTFSVMKAWLREREDELEANLAQLGVFIAHAGLEAITPAIAKAEFKSCGWDVETME